MLAQIELQLGNIAAAEQQADILATFADRAHAPVAAAASLHIRGWVAYFEESLRSRFDSSRSVATSPSKRVTLFTTCTFDSSLHGCLASWACPTRL